MNKRKYKNHGVPNIPKPPPAPRPLEGGSGNPPIAQYEVFPIQLGMCVQDAARLIKKKLNECTEMGYRLHGNIQVNISEAVLIFEKNIKIERNSF